MKKAIVGVAAVGAAVGLGQVIKRMGPRMREHCEQMMAGQSGRRGEAAGMREHCEQMAAPNEEQSEPVTTA